MSLNSQGVVEQTRRLIEYAQAERDQLDHIRRYWKGLQARPAVIPTTAPSEVRVMARSSRVNVLPIIVDSLVQSQYVDGFRAGDRRQPNLDVWKVWQANRMDKRQMGIHRAAAAYGASYAVVLPGTIGDERVPVIRGASPRGLTAIYGEDPDWPMWALERVGPIGPRSDASRPILWRLYDEEAVYFVGQNDQGFEHIETRVHDIGVTPVVRYLDEEDLDADDEVEREGQALSDNETPTRGQVAPYMPLQDQIDLTTFGLQIAQHYGAFRQRYIIGWTAESEDQLMKAAASQVWTFDEEAEGPDSMKIGEFEQTNLDGYIKSREASLRHAATLSQTPVHELTGEMVNLSAEALAAAEAGKDRKVAERQTNNGESHEQTLWLAGQLGGFDVPDDAQVVWRDTTARSFAATIDALGKVAQMLEVPPEELWERIPGVTQQDAERWRKSRAAKPPEPQQPPRLVA